jgi:hypothetical protein
LKGHTLREEQHPKPLVADVVDHPLSHQEVRQLGQRPRRKRQVVILWSAQGELFDLASLRQGERGGTATAIARVQRIEAVEVEVVDHVPDPVSTGEGHLGDAWHGHALRRQQDHLRAPLGHH